MEEAEFWLKSVFNYGFPSVLALFALLGAAKGIRAAWNFFHPLFTRMAEAHLNFLTVSTENGAKVVEAMETLSAIGKDGHGTTHNKLDAVHADVKHIKERFVK